MYAFALSLALLVINLFFVIGYFAIYVLIHITSLFLSKPEEDLWEDDESQFISDFKAWMHSWQCLILIFNLCTMSYF